MNDTVKTKKRWFLIVELAVLILVGGIGIAKIASTDTDSTKVSIAKQVVRIPYKEKINDNTIKAKSETLGLVTGICYSRDKPSAVINNKKIVHEGDTIDGFTIVKIYEDKVEFEKNGKTVVGNIYRTQTATRSESNYLLQQPVNSKQIRYKSSNDYYKQHEPPAYSKPFAQENMGESRWRVFETTTIDGRVRKIKKGTIFKTLSKNIYEVAEIVFLFEMEVKPDVTILTDGQFHKLLIDGVEKPLLCTKLNRGIHNTCSVGRIIEALVINELDGLEHGKIFKLDNGQIWEQEEFYIYTGIFIMPKVTIWHNGVAFKMKIDGVDKPVTVHQLY
ncbi:MAG: hypothetical protein PVH77_12135 [Phycisphaerales bacterium]|jgi:hypothetical protein